MHSVDRRGSARRASGGLIHFHEPLCVDADGLGIGLLQSASVTIYNRIGPVEGKKF
jgi:hypothetical protein